MKKINLTEFINSLPKETKINFYSEANSRNNKICCEPYEIFNGTRLIDFYKKFTVDYVDLENSTIKFRGEPKNRKLFRKEIEELKKIKMINIKLQIIEFV